MAIVINPNGTKTYVHRPTLEQLQKLVGGFITTTPAPMNDAAGVERRSSLVDKLEHMPHALGYHLVVCEDALMRKGSSPDDWPLNAEATMLTAQVVPLYGTAVLVRMVAGAGEDGLTML